MGVTWHLECDPEDDDRAHLTLEFPDGNPASLPIVFGLSSSEANRLGLALMEFSDGDDFEPQGDIA